MPGTTAEVGHRTATARLLHVRDQFDQASKQSPVEGLAGELATELVQVALSHPVVALPHPLVHERHRNVASEIDHPPSGLLPMLARLAYGDSWPRPQSQLR